MSVLAYVYKHVDGDFYNLADPKVRKFLLEQVGVGGHVWALELLWHFYFSNDHERDFDTEERRLMQTLVGEYAKKILRAGGELAKQAIAVMMIYEAPPPVGVLNLLLSWLGDSHLCLDSQLRRLATRALLKFLPQHRDIYDMGPIVPCLNTMIDAETDAEVAGNLRRLRTSVINRCEHDQAQSEPE